MHFFLLFGFTHPFQCFSGSKVHLESIIIFLSFSLISCNSYIKMPMEQFSVSGTWPMLQCYRVDNKIQAWCNFLLGLESKFLYWLPRVSVSVCEQNASKVLNKFTVFLAEVPLCLKKELIDFLKIAPVCKYGVWKSGPHDKRWGGGGHFQAAITAKRWETDMWLLLDDKRNSYVRSPTAPLDLISKGQIQCDSDCELISGKGAQLVHMILL